MDGVFIISSVRSFWRTDAGRDLGAVGVLAGAVAAVGVAYGAQSTAAGLPVWFAPALGAAVYAASAELLFVGVLAAGGSAWVAAAAALAVNARHLPYGVAVRHLVGPGRRGLLRAHLVNDETVAFGLARAAERGSARAGREALTRAGLALLIAWPAGSLAGGLLGRAVDVRTLGLDALFPVVLLALVLPGLATRRARLTALAAAAVATAAVPVVPAGLAPLLGLAALPLRRTGPTRG